MNQEENIKRFEELMEEVKRPGADQLMNYIRKSDFYKAPASTKFHLSVEGGLLQHSLNVFECFTRRMLVDPFEEYHYVVLGNTIAKMDRESLIIIPLLHDICKTYFYEVDYKNQKVYATNGSKRDEKGRFDWQVVPCYVVNDKVPYGHGEKSVMMIEEFMDLTPAERYAIRWHMGYTEAKESWNTLGQAIEKYPLIWALHTADQEASHFIETTDENIERDEETTTRVAEIEYEYSEPKNIGGE